MSLSKATAQAIQPKATVTVVAPKDSIAIPTKEIAGGPIVSGSPSPKSSTSLDKIDRTLTPEEPMKGRRSRSNSADSIIVQHELKGASELAFAVDASGTAQLNGATFKKILEWLLAGAASPWEDRPVQNFLAAYRQWKRPAELFKAFVDKCDRSLSISCSWAHRRAGGSRSNQMTRRPTSCGSGTRSVPGRPLAPLADVCLRGRVASVVAVCVDLFVDRDFFTRKARGRLFNKLLLLLHRFNAAGLTTYVNRAKLSILRVRAEPRAAVRVRLLIT